jgi:hypothetical protein
METILGSLAVYAIVCWIFEQSIWGVYSIWPGLKRNHGWFDTSIKS